MSGDQHLSAEQSEEVADLINAAVSMLRAEDAYHVGLLRYRNGAPELESLSNFRVLARTRFAQLVGNVAKSFERDR